MPKDYFKKMIKDADTNGDGEVKNILVFLIIFCLSINIENGIPILPFYDDENDSEL